MFKNSVPIINDNVKYINWGKTDEKKIWFSDIIYDKSIEIHFYSVFGKKPKKKDKDCVNVFFSGENLEEFVCSNKYANKFAVKAINKRLKIYGDYCTDNMDLSLGFGVNCLMDNYMRFPLWILYLFSPNDSLDVIKRKIQIIEAKHNNFDSKDAALFASHDDYGIRTELFEKLNNILEITCPGKYRHNTGEEWVKDKLEYLAGYKFNICPENVIADGYVTEKLFDSFRAGTIPIYLGGGYYFEDKIVNREAVIFWDICGSNEKSIELINKLLTSSKFYEEFCKIPKFMPNAAEEIFGMICELKDRINKIIEKA